MSETGTTYIPSIRDGWLAADGLVSLKPNAFRPSWHAGYANTCDSDNGILAVVQYMYLFNCDLNFIDVIRRTAHAQIPGLYHRNPSRISYINSHDNYEAMAAGCIFVGDTSTFKTILSHWPVFNDETPGKLKFRRGHPSGIHQPSSIFVYELASGNYNPNWIRVLWHCGNIGFAALYPRETYSHHAERCLSWLRIRATQRVLQRIPKTKRWVIKIVHAVVDVIMNYRVRKYDGSSDWKVFMGYYHRNDHPIAIMSRTNQ